MKKRGNPFTNHHVWKRGNLFTKWKKEQIFLIKFSSPASRNEWMNDDDDDDEKKRFSDFIKILPNEVRKE